MEIENIASSVKDNLPSQNVENSRARKIKKNSNARQARVHISPYAKLSSSQSKVEKKALQRRSLREDLQVISKEVQKNESKKKLDEDDIKIQDGSHSSVVQKVGNEFMQKTTDEGISVHPLPPACIGDLSNERFFALEAGQYFGREFILDIEEYSDKMQGLEYIHRTVKTEKRFRFLGLPIPCTSAHAYERIANECNKDELADKSQGITRPNFVPGIVYQ